MWSQVVQRKSPEIKAAWKQQDRHHWTTMQCAVLKLKIEISSSSIPLISWKKERNESIETFKVHCRWIVLSCSREKRLMVPQITSTSKKDVTLQLFYREQSQINTLWKKCIFPDLFFYKNTVTSLYVMLVNIETKNAHIKITVTK